MMMERMKHDKNSASSRSTTTWTRAMMQTRSTVLESEGGEGCIVGSQTRQYVVHHFIQLRLLFAGINLETADILFAVDVPVHYRTTKLPPRYGPGTVRSLRPRVPYEPSFVQRDHVDKQALAVAQRVRERGGCQSYVVRESQRLAELVLFLSAGQHYM